MLNPKLKPLFNAAYLVIFLKFARKTYRKLNPYTLRFRRKYVLDIPYNDFIVTVGSSNSLEPMVKLANCILDKFPKLSLEFVDLSKMFKSYVNPCHCNEATNIAEVNSGWTGMPPKRCTDTASAAARACSAGSSGT